MNVQIGDKVKSLRKSLGMSIVELSAKSGLSTGMISQIERELACPSVDSLWRIAQSLNVSIGYFFNENSLINKNPVVRKSERKALKMSPSNHLYELLCPDLNQKIEFMHITLEPGNSNVDKLITHEGEECGIVIKGTLLVKYNEEEYVLNEGDSIYLDSTLPHRYVNIGEDTCISVWAMTPPTF